MQILNYKAGRRSLHMISRFCLMASSSKGRVTNGITSNTMMTLNNDGSVMDEMKQANVVQPARNVDPKTLNRLIGSDHNSCTKPLEPFLCVLKWCHVCKKHIDGNGKVFMFGDLRAFCSLECRKEQMRLERISEDEAAKQVNGAKRAKKITGPHSGDDDDDNNNNSIFFIDD